MLIEKLRKGGVSTVKCYWKAVYQATGGSFRETVKVFQNSAGYGYLNTLSLFDSMVFGIEGHLYVPFYLKDESILRLEYIFLFIFIPT